MSAPLPPIFPPREPPHACHNCGEWLKPGESWYCAPCVELWGEPEYDPRPLKPVLAMERNAEWQNWRYWMDIGGWDKFSRESPDIKIDADGKWTKDTLASRMGFDRRYRQL